MTSYIKTRLDIYCMKKTSRFKKRKQFSKRLPNMATAVGGLFFFLKKKRKLSKEHNFIFIVLYNENADIDLKFKISKNSGFKFIKLKTAILNFK
jgi:hypothetical protein